MNIETTEEFWDCECEENFMHSKKIPDCLICGARQEDQPDSRVSEVPA